MKRTDWEEASEVPTMAVMLSKTYAAFKAAGAPDAIAREAAERDRRVRESSVCYRIRCEIAQVDGRHEHRADVRCLASALHGVLVSIVGIVVAAFRLYLGADRRENPTC